MSDHSRTDAAPRRVLFVSYQFPPVGGAGVQRAAKFVKYLPATGWLPSVLTVANPSVPVLDESLLDDIPQETIIRRARTREPGYAIKAAVSGGSGGAGPGLARRAVKGAIRRAANMLLQPDAQILWKPDAVRQGLALLAEVRHSAILVSGPPFSSFLAGAALSRRTGLPLVLDYRDEWGLSNAYLENRRPDPLSRRIQGAMQARVVRTARALVATTESSARALREVRDRAGGGARIACIYNGFDAEDFPAEPPAPRAGGGPFRLAYVGTLWNLTSASPLVEAVLELARSRPDLASHLELVFAGRRTGEQQQLLDRLKGGACRVVEHAYIDHREATGLLRSADALGLLLADLPGGERVVPAKVFEYVAARRPILAIAPRGEVWDILAGHPAACLVAPGDVAGIARFLARAIEQHRAGEPPEVPDWDASRFDRRHQARQLAELLDAVAGPPERGAEGPGPAATGGE